MNKRQDYEHLEREVDGTYYYWINKEVLHALNVKGLELFNEVFDRLEHLAKEESLYYKRTFLYFTWKGKKYYRSWTFYSVELIETSIIILTHLKATNIQINWGELD